MTYVAIEELIEPYKGFLTRQFDCEIASRIDVAGRSFERVIHRPPNGYERGRPEEKRRARSIVTLPSDGIQDTAIAVAHFQSSGREYPPEL